MKGISGVEILESFQSPVLGVFLCFRKAVDVLMISGYELSIPSFRGFSLFLELKVRQLRPGFILSIPSFRGFSLFRDG